MAYNFLQEKFVNFLSSATAAGSFMFARTLDYNTFKTECQLPVSQKTEEILSHDFESFTKLLHFLNSASNIFVLHGFMGCGKSAMVNLLPEMIDSSVLLFRINCFESTNLDDVLLALHTEFVNYHNERKIILPKIESNVFADRINAYIRSGNSPMLFVFDSMDADRCPLQEEIVNFIKHISQIEKIKVVITSRSIAANDSFTDASSNFAIIKLFGKDDFIKLLNMHGIESDEQTYESTFVASKGHYLYISLIINVVSLLRISLKSLYNDYSKKHMTIFDFLISKVLTLIPEKFFKTLWFLSLIRTGVSENFLITQKLSTAEQLTYLEERMLLCREGSYIYLKDYVKQTVSGTLNLQTRKDIHNYLSELYESQLPKKPSERDLVISRSTMRREAAYHKDLAEKIKAETPQKQTTQKNNIDYNYLSYSNSIKKDWIFSESSIAPKQQQRYIKPAPRGMETRINNNLRARQFELSNEELNLLNQLNMKVPHSEFVRPDIQFKIRNNEVKPQETNNQITGQPAEQIENPVIQTPQYVQQEPIMPEVPPPKIETLATVMQEAAVAEQEFNYEKALAIYGKAYSMTEEAGYTEAKPIIMMQTAYCHRRMQNNDGALKCFESAYHLYGEVNPQKADDALFNMAEIYTETYSYTQAKNMYEKILTSNHVLEDKFKIRVLLNLAELENNNSNFETASKYYNEALNLATHRDEKALICETCFKYGLACDDAGETDKAFKLYLRCVQTSSDYEINSFASSAYTNMAEIYEDQRQPEKAIKYFEEAAKIDEQQGNWDILYFGCLKIAMYYQNKSINMAINFASKALEAAKQLNNTAYIASAYIQIGDFYYYSKQNQEALKSYLYAKYFLSQQQNQDNIRKINNRIDNVKSKLPAEIYERIKTEVGLK